MKLLKSLSSVASTNLFMLVDDVAAMAVTKPKILSFGIAAVDFVAVVDHFPDLDEKMRSSSLLVAGGGNAANSACAMGRLSDYCQVDVSTAIGNDSNGNTILDGITENGVGINQVERFDGSSPFSYILTTPDNARTIIHQPSTRDMSESFANKIPIDEYDAVHFDCRHPKAAVVLSEKCAQKGIPYSVDVERPREGLEELLSQATVVICNSDYVDLVLGKTEGDLSDKEIADRLKSVIQKQAPKCDIALQTLGSKGSCLVQMNSDIPEEEVVLLESDEKGHTPLVSAHDGALWCAVWGGCDVVDSTGAGDAFQGGFMTALWSYLKSQPESTTTKEIPTEALARVMRIATRVAAKKLELPGARDGLPRPSEDSPLKTEFQELLGGVEFSSGAETATTETTVKKRNIVRRLLAKITS